MRSYEYGANLRSDSLPEKAFGIKLTHSLDCQKFHYENEVAEGEAELEQGDAKRVGQSLGDSRKTEHSKGSEASKRTEGDAELAQRDGKRRV